MAGRPKTDAEPADLAEAKASGVEQSEQNPIAKIVDGLDKCEQLAGREHDQQVMLTPVPKEWQ